VPLRCGAVKGRVCTFVSDEHTDTLLDQRLNDGSAAHFACGTDERARAAQVHDECPRARQVFSLLPPADHDVDVCAAHAFDHRVCPVETLIIGRQDLPSYFQLVALHELGCDELYERGIAERGESGRPRVRELLRHHPLREPHLVITLVHAKMRDLEHRDRGVLPAFPRAHRRSLHRPIPQRRSITQQLEHRVACGECLGGGQLKILRLNKPRLLACLLLPLQLEQRRTHALGHLVVTEVVEKQLHEA